MTRKQRMTRILRAASGLSQGQFARSAGLSRNRLTHIEAGEAEPTPQEIQAFAHIAGLTAADADELLRYLEALIDRRRRHEQGHGAALSELMDRLNRQLSDTYLRLLSLPAPDAARAVSAEHVEDMVSRLRSTSHEARIWIVRTAEEFQCWELCERACDESSRLAATDPEQAAQWAEIADEIAEQLDKAAAVPRA